MKRDNCPELEIKDTAEINKNILYLLPCLLCYHHIFIVIACNGNDSMKRDNCPELEIKDTAESNSSACRLDLFLSIGKDGQL